jgi:hypothetical protein
MESKPIDISSWPDLLPAQVLGQIVTHLCPADVARFRAVCRAWHSAARQHGQHEQQLMPLSMIVIPNGSIGDLLNQIPSLISPTASPSSSWSDLLPDLLGRVIADLPFPTDRARFRAVCRAWHSAAHQHVRRQLPWLVFPDGSFCTVGADGVFFNRIPGLLPDNVTCLGAAADGWLALDCTDNVFRRTNPWDTYVHGKGFVQPRADVKHRHTYLLHNPFSSRTVALPELDSIIGDVAETFEVRKVLMRSSPASAASPYDDLVAVTTNNWNCNVILCRPGKGSCVLNRVQHVIDVAFHRDRLYGITPEEELVAFDLAEEDNGRPDVTRCWRVIRRPLADGEEDRWRYLYDDDDSDDDDGSGDDDGLGGHEVEEEEEAPEEEQELSDSICFDDGDNMVPDGMVTEAFHEPYKGYNTTT